MKRIHKQVVVSNPCVEENGFFLNENDKMTASPAFETSGLYYLPIDLSHRKKMHWYINNYKDDCPFFEFH